MRVSTDETVEGLTPQRGISWWLDVREGRSDHAFVPGAERHVLHADEHGFELTDHVEWLGVRIFTEHALARARGNTVRVVGENTYARFEARYRFEHAFDPDGTRLVLDADVDLKGPLSWIARLLEPLIQRVVAWDTRKHANQLRDETLQGPDQEAPSRIADPPTR